MRRAGVESRVQSALRIEQVAEPYIRGSALRHLEEGKRRHLRRGHRQPVLHHRHRGGAARARDGRRHRAEGHQGRRRVHRRPEEGPDRAALHDAHLRRGDRQEPEGDGRDGARAVPRPEHAAQGVLDLRARRAQARRAWARTRARSCIAERDGAENTDDRRRQEDGRAEDAEVGRDAEDTTWQGPHRPRAHRPARPHPRRLLRHADADQPGRERHARRRAHDRRAAVGEEDGRRRSRRRSATPTSASIRRPAAT